MADLYFDPYDEAIDLDPYPIWKRLRDEAPLYYNEQYDFYALSRFADVLAASLEWQTYSSAHGTVLEMINPTADSIQPPGMTMPGMMIFMDPPQHDELRRLVSRAFTPRRVSALGARIRELCSELLPDADRFDFLQDYAAKIPAMIIGALLGVPVEMQDRFRVWADEMMRFEPDGPSEQKLHALTQLQEYTAELVRDRRRNPQDDMVSDLLSAELTREDGSTRRLDEGEVMGFFTLLEIAGSETTARLLGWTAVLLARHPDQRRVLRDDPSRIPNAVEELLRYEAPSPIQARLVTRDVEWHGKQVPSGARIALLTGSAGRDERAFPDPDRFDVTRSFERHVTFGHGIHFCIGANLARLEGTVVLDEVMKRMPEWEVDEDNVEMVRTTTVRGPLRVPVTVAR